MDKITDLFAKLVLRNPGKTVLECYNWFIQHIDESMVDMTVKNCKMIIKVGEQIRIAPIQIQEQIRK